MSDKNEKTLNLSDLALDHCGEIGEFKPCVYVVPNMGLTVMQLEDVCIVWEPWGPFKGHAVDLGYDAAGKLVGIQIWDDVARRKS